MNRKDFEAGPLAEAHWRADGDRWTLTFARTLRHPPERVWAALTDPDQLAEWAPYKASGDLGAPGDVTLTMIDGDIAEDLAATVRRADPPTLLEYSWGDDLLRWELAAVAGGTRLTLHHTVAERDMLPNVAAGWHICLVVAERLLDGEPVGPIRGREAMDYGWQELHDRYAAELGVPTPGA